MTPVPREAIDAAAKVICDLYGDKTTKGAAGNLAKFVLTAGAPLIVAAERERIAQLADHKRAVYCKACDGGPCDYSDELGPFASLIREQP
jgi:hypothetical protein